MKPTNQFTNNYLLIFFKIMNGFIQIFKRINSESNYYSSITQILIEVITKQHGYHNSKSNLKVLLLKSIFYLY